MQQSGGAVAGIQTLPSTETDELPSSLAYLGFALMASGAFMLIRQRPQKPLTK
jgi:hypothetical protein